MMLRLLKDTHPEYFKMLHPEHNTHIDINSLAERSNKKVYWLCEKGHEYVRSVDKQITNNSPCPICSGRLLAKGINDIVSKYPKIAEEWDYDANDDLKPEDFSFISSYRVGWKCIKCGHKWAIGINARCVRGNGCPKCAAFIRAENRLSKRELGITDKRLLDEWDYELNKIGPEKYAPFSQKKVHWKCKVCGYRYTATINNKANGRKCACCQRRICVPGINDLTTTHPHLIKEWDFELNGDLKPNHVLAGSSRKIHWICPEGHRYVADLNHRTSKGRETNCPECLAGRQTSFAEQAVYYYVKKIYPDAINRYKGIFTNAMELDIYIPSQKIAIEYDGEAWHKEEKADRELKKNKICQEKGIKLIRLLEKPREADNLRADEGISVLDGPMYEPIHLEKAIRILLDMIDPMTNMWTRKKAGHSEVDVNISRDNNEIRKYMQKVKGSLLELRPDIAEEWDYKKNGDVTPEKVQLGSDAKYFWICPTCKKSYLASIGHRTDKKHPTGCPDCAIRKNAEQRMKPVNMMDPKTGEVIRQFNSISEASDIMKINRRNICTVCRGNTTREKAGGFKWAYASKNNVY